MDNIRFPLLFPFFLYFARPNTFTRSIQAQCIHWFLDRLEISMAHICRYCHLHLGLSQKRAGFFPYVLVRTKKSFYDSKLCHTVATTQFPGNSTSQVKRWKGSPLST
jgi:hypothetical protein